MLDGTVQAMNGATTTEIGKKKGMLFDPAGTAAPTLVSKNEKGPYADWDKQQVDYHNHFAPIGSSHYASTPYSYGLADMNYYGGFSNMGGCGMMWQPYLVSAGWSPFTNGTWAWYPGAGYSWVSPYPWGWTAFHSGIWNYCPGAGWGWQPNNAWNGAAEQAALTKPGKPTGLRPPIARPHPLGPTAIAVNQKPLVASKLNENSFTFRKDSAGLGVPRATFGKLNSISSDVAHHGTLERGMYIPSEGNSAHKAILAPQRRIMAIALRIPCRRMATGDADTFRALGRWHARRRGALGACLSSGSFGGGGAAVEGLWVEAPGRRPASGGGGSGGRPPLECFHKSGEVSITVRSTLFLTQAGPDLVYEVADLLECLFAHFDSGQIGAFGGPDSSLESFEDCRGQIRPQQQTAQGVAVCGVGVVPGSWQEDAS